MKYESMLKILRVLAKSKIILTTRQIRMRAGFASVEGVRKNMLWLFEHGLAARVIFPSPKRQSPGRTKYYWGITPEGLGMVERGAGQKK